MSRVERDYFGWRAPGHAEGCRRTGWEVRHREDEHSTGHRDLVVQAVCPLPGGCGAVTQWSAHLAPDRDDSGDRRSGTSYSNGSVAHIGYGTAPIRVGGAWLHSGPPLLAGYDNDAPDYYIVTGSHAPPTRREDVLGMIGQARTRGRLVKSRWWARADYRWEPYGTWSPAHATDECTSRGAAVAWVLQHEAPAAAGQPAGGA